MAKPIKPLTPITEGSKNIVQQALGHLAPQLHNMETRAAYGGGLPDVVLCFDTAKEAGDVAKFMLEEMNITNAAGEQKRIARRNDGKWEVLVSDKQMSDMAAFSKNKENGLAAAGGPQGGPPLSPPPSPKAAAAVDEPRCNVVASAANPMSVTFEFKTPQELEAFTKCFPKTVPNYTIEGNSLVIRQSKEPGSIPLRRSVSGSVALDFGGKGRGQEAMLNHMEKLFPKAHSQFGSLYFNPGASQNVPYQLTKEAETEAFKRELAFKRLDNIALLEKAVIRHKRGLYTDEMLAEGNLKLQDAILTDKKAEISRLVNDINPDQKRIVEEYINNPTALKRISPEGFFKEQKPDIDQALLRKIQGFRELNGKTVDLRVAANEVQKSRAEIETLNSLLATSGDRAKYEPIHRSMQDNDVKLNEAKEALNECERKANKFIKSAFAKEFIVKEFKGKSDQKGAIDHMASKHQHGVDEEFKAYLQALFDQKPGNLSEKIDYAYERMNEDLQKLQQEKKALQDLGVAIQRENDDLSTGTKTESDPELKRQFDKVTEAIKIAATVHHNGAKAAAAIPPKTPEEIIAGLLGDKASYTTEVRPAMVNRGGEWVADPVKKDIVLVFKNRDEAITASQALKAPPYGIGGQGAGGMKVINSEKGTFTIKLSEDNINAISNGLDKLPQDHRKDAAAALVGGMQAKQGQAPKAPVPHAKPQAGAHHGLG